MAKRGKIDKRKGRPYRLQKSTFNFSSKLSRSLFSFVSGHSFRRAAPRVVDEGSCPRENKLGPEGTAESHTRPNYSFERSSSHGCDALYQGTTLQVAEQLMLCIRARLYRLRNNSCFVSGHDFSRAVKRHNYEGFSP
jgi:hypothetical protein